MKKAIALLMALVLMLSVCACGKKPEYVGKWRMESYDTQEAQSATFTLYAHIELLDDGKFSITGHTVTAGASSVDSNPAAEREYVNGVYKVDGKKFDFTVEQLNEDYGMHPVDDPTSFTGEIEDDGKLHCLITGHKVIFVKE